MKLTLLDIQKAIGGEIEGAADVPITGVGALETADEGAIVFAEKAGLHAQAGACRASAVVVGPDFPPLPGKSLLRIDRPRLAFVRVMMLFEDKTPAESGVHPSAVIEATARLAEGVAVGPCAVVKAGASLGPDTIVHGGAYIGRRVVIGGGCRIGPNAVLMDGVRLGDRVIVHGGSVIGGDGFGYQWAEGRHLKVPQLGTVQIDDDVEIGCNVCIDRATLGVTRIRRGTKIDNLVHVGHNNDIGEDVILTGQVGLAGSVTIGNRVMFGGQSAVADHVTIGEGAVVAGAAPVIGDVGPGETVWGFPARPMARVKREMASVARLPELIKQVRALSAQVAELQARLEGREAQED